MSVVYVLGSLNMDTTYYVPRIPEVGVTLASTHSHSAPGGKGLNQAVATAWAGADVALIGAVGADGNGQALTDVLRRYPVSMAYLMTVDAPTGTAVIFVDTDGRNCIVVNGGANQKVPVRDIGFQPGDTLVAQLETNLDAVLGYFSRAKAAGARTVLNLSPSRPVPEALLQSTALLIVNEHEAGALIGRPIRSADDALEAWPSLRALGIEEALITLGENGVAVLTDTRQLHIPGEKVNAQDTQGAGDAFLGITLGCLAQGMPLEEAARKANHIAARCVEVEGSTLISLQALNKED